MHGSVLLFFVLLLGPSRAPRESLHELVRSIPAVAVDTDGGIGPEAEELAKRIQAHGADAVPLMLPLLESPSGPVREFAGYVLRDLDGLTEDHLDTLIRALQRGNGWIPPAIGRIGTPRAIAALVADLKADPESMTQVTGALEDAGEKAADALARSFRDPDPLSDEYARCVREILGGMKGPAASAIDPLLEIALANDVRTIHRRYAVQAIGETGLAARRAIPFLRDLVRTAPADFNACVEEAIVGIGGPEAAPILAEWLKTKPDPWRKEKPDILLFWKIAELRGNGLEAGDEVSEYLTHEDHDIRVAAARTLGWIGYTNAADALARVVGQEDDWQLAFASAESLGRLRSTACIPALEKAAATHWFPPVQVAARKAIAVIRGAGESGPPSPPDESAGNFFDYDRVGGEGSERGELPHLSTGPGALTADQLEKLRYQAEIESFDETGEHTNRSQQRPDCGLKVAGGFLLGSSRGEWGGEVVQIIPGAPQRILLAENVLALHRTPAGIIAVAGVANLLPNRDVLYRIDPRPDGLYEAVWWKRLPGEPERSGLLEDGSLFVRCRGGDVVVTSQGEMRLAKGR